MTVLQMVITEANLRMHQPRIISRKAAKAQSKPEKRSWKNLRFLGVFAALREAAFDREFGKKKARAIKRV